VLGIQRKIYNQLDPLAWPKPGLSPANRLILSIVALSIVVAVLQTEPNIFNPAQNLFWYLNLIFAVIFIIEYVVRFWAMGAHPDYKGVIGRIKYAFTLASVFDLIATLALWKEILFGINGTVGVLLRIFRALRVVTLMRNSRWARAIKLLRQAVSRRRFELFLSFGFAVVVLLISATVLFIIEGDKQPEAFGSIPRAMWWAMATLTTVGYGDVYPITALGKIFAGVVAVTAIAIVAMPTGIMAAALSDAFHEIQTSPTDTEDEKSG
jgi:voltage-gated potassium channel